MLQIIKEAGLSPVSTDAKAIRDAVFVQEQHINPALEFDDQDGQAIHYVGYLLPDTPVTTARIHEHMHEWRVGRVATLKEMRGQGLGKQLLEQVINDAKQQGISAITLGAQVHARPFYERLGFSQVGDIFLEANIEHIKMTLVL